jgi:hypothetical protein
METITVRELHVGDWIQHEGHQLEVMRIRRITQRRKLIAFAPKGQRHEEPIWEEEPLDTPVQLICRWPLMPWDLTSGIRKPESHPSQIGIEEEE